MPTDQPTNDRARLGHARRFVVKLGSAVLAPKGELDQKIIDSLAAQIAREPRRQCAVVSSGAVASGFRALGLSTMPRSIVQKQAAAAVGQQRLMAAWSAAFASHGRTVAQVLLTGDDLADRTRLLNARRTLEELLASGIVPIINENDSVSYDEIKVGDNDRLSSLVAGLVAADLLLVLSGVDGLYAGGDPRRIVPFVASIEEARSHIQTGTSAVGTGGMATKLLAAQIARDAGIAMVIAGGRVESVINRVLAGEALGTYFAGGRASRPARQRWLGQSARPAGTVVVDEGAKAAIIRKGASLLPSGIVGINGSFLAGATVDLRVASHPPFARGVAAYSSAEIAAIKGKRSSNIAAILGYCYSGEVVHRDNMALLVEGGSP